MAKREKPNVPHPSSEQVEHYLRAWDELENYHLQEDALDKLFFTLCPENSDMSDIHSWQGAVSIRILIGMNWTFLISVSFLRLIA